MEDLTPRQIEILKAIITEYTETGEAVGSDILDKKFNLGVSPATIRNEMVELAKKNYLKKSYFSSGRLPTSQAFRFYISNLMNEKEYYRAHELAEKLRVNVMTIYRYIKAKKFKAYKIGKEFRIDKTEFEAFLKRVSTK